MSGSVRRSDRRGRVAPLRLLALGILAALSGLAASPSPGAGTIDPPSRADIESVPILAYYYIWFDASSWERAKVDQPALGPYSSDDPAVMRQHVTWAKAAGIDGFIVSWKSTAVLDRRLEQLIAIATELDFKLVIIYQALDFSREPIGTEIIAEDLDRFIAEYADAPVFDVWGKPAIIWSGTWQFDEAEIEDVAGVRRDRLLILGTERSLDGIARISSMLDGNAYYWASVNPASNRGYEAKLRAMSDAVHDAGGRWIAPAAPGFDARLLGGSTVVDRRDGETLALELDAAIRSLPDAVGVISWNEFSENTHIEPSDTYGDRYLGLLAEWHALPPPHVPDLDSSASEGLDVSPLSRLAALLLVAGLAVVSFLATIRRTRTAS